MRPASKGDHHGNNLRAPEADTGGNKEIAGVNEFRYFSGNGQ
jgi:hypothetical protein